MDRTALLDALVDHVGSVIASCPEPEQVQLLKDLCTAMTTKWVAPYEARVKVMADVAAARHLLRHFVGTPWDRLIDQCSVTTETKRLDYHVVSVKDMCVGRDVGVTLHYNGDNEGEGTESLVVCVGGGKACVDLERRGCAYAVCGDILTALGLRGVVPIGDVASFFHVFSGGNDSVEGLLDVDLSDLLCVTLAGHDVPFYLEVGEYEELLVRAAKETLHDSTWGPLFQTSTTKVTLQRPERKQRKTGKSAFEVYEDEKRAMQKGWLESDVRRGCWGAAGGPTEY